SAVSLSGDEIGLEADHMPELGRVGQPRPSAPQAVVDALAAGLVPVVSPLARGPLNVNADEAASALAVGLGASRVQVLTEVACGRRYRQLAAGIAVVGLGHRHSPVPAAAHAQLDRLWHASNLYGTEPAQELAQVLAERFGGAQAFFCNSGAEANEAALKYARKATGKPGVLALEQSFHGRTIGALAVTGQPAKRAPFEPLLAGARFAKPNDVESLHA